MWELAATVLIFGASPEYSIEELRASYEQNRSAFVTLSVEAMWELATPDEFKDTLRNHVGYAERQLTTLENREKLYSFLKARGFLKDSPLEDIDPKNEKAFVLAVTQHVRSRYEIPGNTVTTTERTNYIVGIDETEVRRFVKADDVRRKDAVGRGISSFSGGDYSIIQSGRDGKWTCLEPYPFVAKRVPSAWKTSGVDINVLIPPFVDKHGLKPGYSNNLSRLWARTEDVVSFGILANGSAELQIVGKPISGQGFLLAGISTVAPDLPIPRWIAECRHFGKEFDEIDNDRAQELANQIVSLRDNWSAKRLSFAMPNRVVYFEDLEDIEHGGRYPSRLVFRLISSARTAADMEVEPADLPMGWSKAGTLELLRVKAGSDVEPITPLELPNGTLLLDIDSNLASRVGENIAVSLGQLTDRPRSKSTRSLFLLFNLCAVVVIVVSVILRRFYLSRPVSGGSS